jgi:hypothetical protein
MSLVFVVLLITTRILCRADCVLKVEALWCVAVKGVWDIEKTNKKQ